MKTNENENEAADRIKPLTLAQIEREAMERFPDSREARQAYVNGRCKNNGITPRVLQ